MCTWYQVLEQFYLRWRSLFTTMLFMDKIHRQLYLTLGGEFHSSLCMYIALTFSLESRTNTLTSPASNSTSSFAPWFSIVCAPGGTFLNPRNPPTMGTSFPLQTMTSFQMSLSTNQAAVYKVIQRWISTCHATVNYRPSTCV